MGDVAVGDVVRTPGGYIGHVRTIERGVLRVDLPGIGERFYTSPDLLTVLGDAAAPSMLEPKSATEPELTFAEFIAERDGVGGAEPTYEVHDEVHVWTTADATNPKDLLGVRKAPLRFVPWALRILAAPAMALGAAKYGAFNWRKTPVRMTVYLEAIDRHLAAFADGQDLDPESGASHLSHVAACVGIIADAQALGNLIDDRFEPGPAAAMLEALDTTK